MRTPAEAKHSLPSNANVSKSTGKSRRYVVSFGSEQASNW